MKETFARMLYECHCQCRILRFEERAREFISVAMANLYMGSRSESNMCAALRARHDVYKCVESLG